MPAIVSNVIYTVHQVSEMLHCSRKTVYRLIEEKTLKAKKRGRITLILGSDLLAYWETLPDADGDISDDDNYPD